MAAVTDRLAAVPLERMHLWLMLVLTFTTGIVDAVGYLGLDKVFTGNMTGNVVILGMALVGADGLPIVGPVLALVGFMAGAALGGRLLRRAGDAWTHVTTGLFAGVGVAMLALAMVLLLSGSSPESSSTTASTRATVRTVDWCARPGGASLVFMIDPPS